MPFSHSNCITKIHELVSFYTLNELDEQTENSDIEFQLIRSSLKSESFLTTVV